jgi:hypothetical protein
MTIDNLFEGETLMFFFPQQLVIREGTEAYNAWVSTPIPVYTRFYFFHIHNPEEILANHSKPILEERGPYTFRLVENGSIHRA